MNEFDDAKLSQLVRDTADTWAMPPVRLDQPGWRERVRAPRRRGASGLGELLRRFAGAAVVAAVLTVVVAVVAVLIPPRAPNGPVGPGPSATPTPGGPATTASPGLPSPLPPLLLEGDLPTVTQPLVRIHEGGFAVADLTSGKLGNRFADSDWGTEVRRAADGSYYCVCVVFSGSSGGRFTHVTINFERYTAGGDFISRSELGSYTGEPDPRVGADWFEQAEHVRATVSFGPDPRYAFVGWSYRARPVWRSGFLVVDVEQGRVVSDPDLDDVPIGEGNSLRMTDAPVVVGSAGSDLIIGRAYYTSDLSTPAEPNYQPNVDAFRATFVDGNFLAPIVLDSNRCGDYIERGGGLPDGGTWLACRNGFSQMILRRIGGDGGALGDTAVNVVGDLEGTTSAVSPDGKSLYVWHPIDLRLTRIDVGTGDKQVIDAAPSANSDILTSLVNWLVPSAQAKMLLSSGLVISADGSRLYALGVNPAAEGAEPSGSTGVYAFDLSEGTALSRWAAAADFVSLALSSDGKFVYAVGMPGVDANGKQAAQPASVTVYDAATGEIRLVAGSLGSRMMVFPQTLLP